ncbi:glycogen synthase [Bradyrhizobium sp. i1.4.4]
MLQAQARAPHSIAVKIGFDDAEARKIFAGSDFTLMPSRFEPCGLSQMYAQRFGSLPIGHRTGGLAETIVDGETGLLFDRASALGFLGSLLPGLLDFWHEGPSGSHAPLGHVSGLQLGRLGQVIRGSLQVINLDQKTGSDR